MHSCGGEVSPSLCAYASALLLAGYLIYDVSNILVYWKYLGDTTAIIHHLIFAAAAAYVLVHSIMAFPFVWLALGELSTPAVNLRWV